MKKIAQGLPLKKYIGNKHKDGGIMVNALGNKTKDVDKAVAEVEGGEYNFRYDSTNPMNNYIIPARETFPEVNDMAKQADRFKGNNRIDYNTRTNLLNKSMKLNEMLRVQQEQQPMQMAAFGGKLKKYINGSFLLKGSQSIVDSMVANSKANDTTKIATAPEIKLGTTTAPKLETIKLPTLPTTTPKTTAEAANTGMQVNTQNDATPEPTINKKGVKDITSGLSGVASAFGPIGQAVGMGIQLAPYAIDLGKAMFDKTSVQDLQIQGSAMRLPNTTYAKNGGKLNVVPLPKFQPGGKTPRMQKIGDYSFDSNLLYPASQAIQLQASTQGDYTNNKVFMTPDYKMVIRNPIDGSYRFFNQQSVQEQITKNNPIVRTKTDVPVTTTNTGKNKGVKTTPVVSDTPTDAEIEEAKKTRAKFKENPLSILKTLPETIKSTKPGINNLKTLDVKKEMDIAKKAGLNVVPQPSESESSRLYKAGQTKQKLSEALMYGMAALPSEQIKTITPDYGRGDDAMSRMGLSTEPIRQEMMQGANKALELTRSQVGTAGQLQSRGQSIMSNVGSQLAQSQVQQQQYLNQLRAALAQREDTKANVLAQSELIAREARSAERAAKLDQLNNAISQTSAIGAGTMEQASKMSTIENENERYKRQQMQLMDMANMAGGFKVAIKDGKAVLEYDATGSGKSNIKQADLSNPNPLVVKDNPVAPATTTTPKEHVVKQGEGFNDIAAKYKIPVDKLLKLNNLKIGDTIHPNQKLKIE